MYDIKVRETVLCVRKQFPGHMAYPYYITQIKKGNKKWGKCEFCYKLTFISIAVTFSLRNKMINFVQVINYIDIFGVPTANAQSLIIAAFLHL